MSPRPIQVRVESGWLVRVHRTVYRLAGGRSRREQALPAACLSAGRSAVASHRSAGAVWGLRGEREERPEITVPGGRHRRMPGAAVHRTNEFGRLHVTAPTESVLEDAMVRVLREAGLPAPVRQHEVGGMRLDLAYPDIRLGIEADSLSWHGGRVDVQRSSDKANLLLARGWRALHFTGADVPLRPAHVVDSVAHGVALAWPA